VISGQLCQGTARVAQLLATGHCPLTTGHCFQSLAPFINSLENISTTYKEFAIAGDSGGGRVEIDLWPASVLKVSRTGLESRSAGIPHGIASAGFAFEVDVLRAYYQ
jgi:hypothetical protein